MHLFQSNWISNKHVAAAAAHRTLLISIVFFILKKFFVLCSYLWITDHTIHCCVPFLGWQASNRTMNGVFAYAQPQPTVCKYDCTFNYLILIYTDIHSFISNIQVIFIFSFLPFLARLAVTMYHVVFVSKRWLYFPFFIPFLNLRCVIIILEFTRTDISKMDQNSIINIYFNSSSSCCDNR